MIVLVIQSLFMSGLTRVHLWRAMECNRRKKMLFRFLSILESLKIRAVLSTRSTCLVILL